MRSETQTTSLSHNSGRFYHKTY